MRITQPVPPFRSDIQVHLVTHENQDVLILHDPEGIADQNLMLEADLLNIIQLLDGSRSVRHIYDELQSSLNASVDISQLAMFIRALDEACLLESDHYASVRDFLDADVCQPVCAGASYPDDAESLRSFLDEIMQSSPARAYPTNAKAVFIPHIDLRVGAQTYAPPFHAISQSDFNLVVHIGTSHYGWQDRFLLTEKDFLTPLGTLRTDKELVRTLRDALPFSLTQNDIAYRPEHALELHHIFLQHLFAERDFTLLPVLVTSFHDHVEKQHDPLKDERIAIFCETLKRIVEESGKKAVYIVSGDLAHIGKRFGDEWEAAPMLDTIRMEDYEVLDALAHGKSYDFFLNIARNHDRRRICGLPPAYTMLQTLNPGKGVVLGYEQWDDSPTGSAVSYGSVAWW